MIYPLLLEMLWHIMLQTGVVTRRLSSILMSGCAALMQVYRCPTTIKSSIGAPQTFVLDQWLAFFLSSDYGNGWTLNAVQR